MMNTWLILIILFCGVVTNCFPKENIIIKSKKIVLDKATLSMKQDDFIEVDEEDLSYWRLIDRKFNFFRIQFKDVSKSYREYDYEVKGVQYKKIFVCMNFDDWRERRYFLWSLFRDYEEEINSMVNITVVLRSVYSASYVSRVRVSDCLILTGAFEPKDILQ